MKIIQELLWNKMFMEDNNPPNESPSQQDENCNSISETADKQFSWHMKVQK